MFIFGKVKLHAYNIPRNDSWLNRQFLKFGEPPVLYSDRLTGLSMEQIRLKLANKGYLNAKVDTVVVKKDRKANVTYKVTGNEPYLVRSFKDSIYPVDSTIYRILDMRRRLAVVKEGDIFDQEMLEKGRIATSELRNSGYFNSPRRISISLPTQRWAIIRWI